MGNLILLDGFVHWDTNDPAVKWDTVNNYNSMEVSAAYGRNGSGMSLYTGGTSVGHQLETSYPGSAGAAAMLEKYFPSGYGPVTGVNIGFAIKLNDVELGYSIPLVAMIDRTESDTSVFTQYYLTQVSLLLTPQQQLVFCTGNHLDIPPLLGSNYSPPLKRGVFSFIEIEFQCGNPGSVFMSMDGRVVVSDSINTKPTGNPFFSGVRFFHHLSLSPNYVRNYHIDDVYVVINGGARFNDSVIETAMPTSNGAVRQWTPSDGGTLNYDMVNELSPNDDVDYNMSSVAGHEDTYVYPPLANTSGTVHGVTINAVAINAGPFPGSIMMSGVYREGGVSYLSDQQQIGTIIYHANIFGFSTNPATGNRFSIAEVNAGELGIRRIT